MEWLRFLKVETIAFTVLNYPMSYIEFVGTILYLASVCLIARRHMLTWPVGILSVLLYMALFYQIRLYADVLEQVYFLGASIYGWWYWKQTARENETELPVFYSSSLHITASVGVTGVLTLLLTAILLRVHEWLPDWFPERASYPFWDALTTVMSFVAMWLLARRRVESWLMWIVVDVIGIWLYYVKEVRFVSLLYVMLLGMAISGFWSWHKARQEEPALAVAA